MLQFEDISSLKKMMELDGRTLGGGLPAAKVKEIEQVYTVSQIFDFLATKLETRDKIDQYNKGPIPNDRFRSPTKDPRYVRIADKGDKCQAQPQNDKNTQQQQPRGRRTESPGSGSTTRCSSPATPKSTATNT